MNQSGKRILSFYPHNPFPPRSGSHLRCTEMLRSLRELGCEVHLASSTLTSETKWDFPACRQLEEEIGIGVHLAPRTVKQRIDRALASMEPALHWRVREKIDRLRRGLQGGIDPYCSPELIRWFRGLCDQVMPDCILMNYTMWDGLVDHQHWKGVNTIVDTLDLFSLNTRMRNALQPFLQAANLKAGIIASSALELDFYDRLNLTADRAEFDVIDRYRHAIAISRREADDIRRATCNVHVVRVPMSMAVVEQGNQHDGNAIMTLGPNPFNMQGYFFLALRVMPLIRCSARDFRVDVTGSIESTAVAGFEGMGLLGFVPSLQTCFAHACFAVNPVFGGTGQQIKTLEAMAHGLPVVLLRGPARESPVRHGENGFVAENEEAFAEYCVKLWMDRNLCREMGACARETIRNECGRSKTVSAMADIIGR